MSKDLTRRAVLSGAAAVVAAAALPVAAALSAAKGIDRIPPKFRRYLEARAAPMPLEEWLKKAWAEDDWRA